MALSSPRGERDRASDRVNVAVVSTILKNVVQFTGLVIGVPVALPHLLNVNGVAIAQQQLHPAT
jgi:hypothetical protein